MQKDLFSHFPRGLFYVFFCNLFAMVGIVMFNALLVLYLTNQLGFKDEAAYSLFAAYGALFYGSSLFGGILGSHQSHRNCMLLGCLLAVSGLFVFVIPGHLAVYLGLSLFITGNGLLVPNVNCVVGQLYAAGDKTRDSGYTLVYMGTNVGALIAGLSSGYIVKFFSYRAAFMTAGGLTLGAIVFLCLGLRVFRFGEHTHFHKQLASPSFKRDGFPMIFLSCVCLIPIYMWLLNHSQLSNYLILTLASLAFLGIAIRCTRESKADRTRMLIFLFLIMNMIY